MFMQTVKTNTIYNLHEIFFILFRPLLPFSNPPSLYYFIPSRNVSCSIFNIRFNQNNLTSLSHTTLTLSVNTHILFHLYFFFFPCHPLLSLTLSKLISFYINLAALIHFSNSRFEKRLVKLRSVLYSELILSQPNIFSSLKHPLCERIPVLNPRVYLCPSECEHFKVVRGLDILQSCLALCLQNLWLISVKKLSTFNCVVNVFLPLKFKLISANF